MGNNLLGKLIVTFAVGLPLEALTLACPATFEGEHQSTNFSIIMNADPASDDKRDHVIAVYRLITVGQVKPPQELKGLLRLSEEQIVAQASGPNLQNLALRYSIVDKKLVKNADVD